MQEHISDILNDSLNNLEKVISDKGLILEIETITTKIIKAFKDGNKLLLCGNGGSASDAQHIAAELSGRFIKERKRICRTQAFYRACFRIFLSISKFFSFPIKQKIYTQA